MSIQCSKGAFRTAFTFRYAFIAPIERLQLALLCFKPKGDGSLKVCRTQNRNYASGLSPKRRLPRNKEISSSFIHIVSPDGKLSPPVTTWSVLNSVNTSTHTLVTVALPAERGGSIKQLYEEDDGNILDEEETFENELQKATGQQGPEYPICKIILNKELWEMEKHKAKKKAKNATATLKTIELNWAIDGNDLKHRFDRIREFLEKGFRVEVIMAGKKKGKKATLDQAVELLKTVKAVTDIVPGARENKIMEGRVIKKDEGGKMVLGQVVVYLEGKLQK